jgi:hypothetical protein
MHLSTLAGLALVLSGFTVGGCSGSETDAPRTAPGERLRGDVAHPLDHLLRLNHLQAKGTHNSYHQRPAPETIPDWDYSMAPLYEQFSEQGVRKVELDLHWDEEIEAFRVYHLFMIDEVSSCDLFIDCLGEMKQFSDEHPGHHPLFVQIEPKGAVDGMSTSEFTAAMEAEIAEVFPDDLLVTPDLVRGDDADLASAIAQRGWPTLGEVRGRVLFFLDCDREFCLGHANDGAGLHGRTIFADSEPGDPFLAVRVMNTPGEDVADAVAAGQIVRTRAVSITDALEGDASALAANLDAALASGAQLISTDVPVERSDVPFVVKIPGGSPSRCNPITAPAECTAAAIEDPALIVPVPM